MKRRMEREEERKGEQKTESNWFCDGFQLHGSQPGQLFMTSTRVHTHAHTYSNTLSL